VSRAHPRTARVQPRTWPGACGHTHSRQSSLRHQNSHSGIVTLITFGSSLFFFLKFIFFYCFAAITEERHLGTNIWMVVVLFLFA
jgi:hypothetical protein